MVSAHVRVEILVLLLEDIPVGHMHLHHHCCQSFVSVWRYEQEQCPRPDIPHGTMFHYASLTPPPSP